MQLTPHFKLSEFTKSATATRHGIDNTLNPSNPEHAKIIANLRNLCVHVLEPLRTYINQSSPIKGGERGVFIGSGYRSPQLNAAVGGVANSQHMKGEAADIHLPSTAIGREWMRWIIDNTDFDQCIFETADRKRYWIHVSCKADRTKNRHHVISFLLKK